MTETIVGIVFVFFLIFGLFILLRQLVNWYFRINERYDIMVKTYRKLDEISKKLGDNTATAGWEADGENKGTVYYKLKK